MRYGYFDDNNREYVIQDPNTPMSWVNYLGTDEYCGIISNNAAGYGFHQVGQEQAAHPLSLQQRPDGPTRQVRLRPRRLGWRLLVRDVATGRQAARSIQDHLRARPRLHPLHQRISRHPHQQPLLRPHRREPRALGSRGREHLGRDATICRSSRTPSGASGT